MESNIKALLVLALGLNLSLTSSCGIFRNVNKSNSTIESDSASNSSFHKGIVDTGSVFTYRRFTPFVAPALDFTSPSGTQLTPEEMMKMMAALYSNRPDPAAPVVLHGTYYIPGMSPQVPGSWEEWTKEKKGFSANLDSSSSTSMSKNEDDRHIKKQPDGNLMLWVLGFVLAIFIAAIVLLILINKSVNSKIRLKWQA